MNENDVMFTIMIRQRHAIHVGPVAAVELLQRVVIILLQMSGITGLSIVEQTQLVVAQERRMGVFPGESDHLGAVGAAIDQVAEKDDAIVVFEVQLVQEVLQFPVAAVNVTDGDESAFHAAAVIAKYDLMGDTRFPSREGATQRVK